MKTKQEQFEALKQLWETFETEHNKTTKVSDANARKALGEMKKMVTDYRKVSVSESKA